VEKRKRKNTNQGLGDTIEMITKLTGIKQIVKTIVGDDCGCNKRKDKLNDKFPYKTKDNE